MPPDALREYFSQLSEVHGQILQEMAQMQASIGSHEAWEALPEAKQDRLLSQPFVDPALEALTYEEEAWGRAVVSLPAKPDESEKVPTCK